MENHFPPLSVNIGIDTTAFWSRSPNGHVLVFVHGFTGKAQATWEAFPQVILSRPEFAGCDAVFFGYRSVKSTVTSNANQLIALVDLLLEPGLRPVNHSIQRYLLGIPRDPTRFKFTRVTFVAHSLGAIVTRDALVAKRYENDPKAVSWKGVELRMLLFAPAHMGADIEALVCEAITGFAPGKLVWVGAHALVKPLRELHPESQHLKDLKDRSKELHDAGFTAVKATRVVHVQGGDRVVFSDRFLYDPPAREVTGKGHSSMCKPSRGYDDPIDHLLAMLP